MKTKCNLCGEESADERWEMDTNLDLICPVCGGRFSIELYPSVSEAAETEEKSDSANRSLKMIPRYRKSVIGTPMHGDLIEFKGRACEASVQGYQGAYRYIDGVCTNCAMADRGFVKYNGVDYRVKWTNRARIFKRKHPELFPQENW